MSQSKSIDVSTLLLLIAVVWVGVIMWQTSDTPLPTPKPTPQNEVAEVVEKSSAQLRQGMADVYRQAASKVEAGDIKTVTAFSEFVYPRNRELRQSERSSLQELMEQRLGDNDLDKDSAAAFLRELADAYGVDQ